MSTRSKPAKLTKREVAVAKKLRALTGGMITIDAEPGTQGHVYSGFLDTVQTFDFIFLDDRTDPNVEQQLIDELARISQVYLTIAGRVAAKCGKSPPARPDLFRLAVYDPCNEDRGVRWFGPVLTDSKADREIAKRTIQRIRDFNESLEPEQRSCRSVGLFPFIQQDSLPGPEVALDERTVTS